MKKIIRRHEITFHSYLRTIALGSVLLYVSVVLFNYFVDPFSIYGMPLHEGLNANKPVLFKNLRLTKAHVIERVKPDALVIGSSRTEHGLNPEHPAMMQDFNSFNLALNGATIYENLRYFQHANAVNPLKMVVLAVDFFQFNAYRPNTPDFSENRLEADIHGDKVKLPKTTDVMSTLASVDATMASFKTLMQQQNRDYVILDRGQVAQPDEDSIAIRGRGRHEAALYSELNYINHLYFPRPYKKFDFISKEKKANTFDYFRRILEDAHRGKIRMYIMISPAHARQWLLVDRTGLWDKWEYWKKELVRLNEEVARWFKHEPFPLWDFSGFNTYTTEPVPEIGDRKNMMRWYWESSHYRVELGDLVLDRVLGYSDPNRPIADDFGVKLRSDIIDQHLEWIREGRADYIQKHPKAAEEINDLVRKYMGS